jgi:hypothetical protein
MGFVLAFYFSLLLGLRNESTAGRAEIHRTEDKTEKGNGHLSFVYSVCMDALFVLVFILYLIITYLSPVPARCGFYILRGILNFIIIKILFKLLGIKSCFSLRCYFNRTGEEMS